MNSKQSGRRRFLKGSAAALGMAAVGGVRPASGQQESRPAVIPHSGARPVSEISQYENLVRTGNQSRAMTPLQDLQGMITPSHLQRSNICTRFINSTIEHGQQLWLQAIIITTHHP